MPAQACRQAASCAPAAAAVSSAAACATRACRRLPACPPARPGLQRGLALACQSSLRASMDRTCRPVYAMRVRCPTACCMPKVICIQSLQSRASSRWLLILAACRLFAARGSGRSRPPVPSAARCSTPCMPVSYRRHNSAGGHAKVMARSCRCSWRDASGDFCRRRRRRPAAAATAAQERALLRAPLPPRWGFGSPQRDGVTERAAGRGWRAAGWGARATSAQQFEARAAFLGRNPLRRQAPWADYRLRRTREGRTGPAWRRLAT